MSCSNTLCDNEGTNSIDNELFCTNCYVKNMSNNKDNEEETNKEEVKPKRKYTKKPKDEIKNEEEEEVKPKRKYTKKPKDEIKKENNEYEEEELKEEVKPKRKYTKKPKDEIKNVEEEVKPKRKYNKKPKDEIQKEDNCEEDNCEEELKKEVKPKRKYNKKPKDEIKNEEIKPKRKYTKKPKEELEEEKENNELNEEDEDEDEFINIKNNNINDIENEISIEETDEIEEKLSVMDSETYNTLIEVLNNMELSISNVKYIGCYNNISVFSMKHNKKNYIIKIQLLSEDRCNTIKYEYKQCVNYSPLRLVKFKNMDKPFIYEKNKYLIMFQGDYDNILNGIMVTKLTDEIRLSYLKHMIEFISNLHKDDYMFLDMNINEMVIFDNHKLTPLILSKSFKSTAKNTKLDGGKLNGNKHLASVNICKGNSGCKNDDIESLLYLKHYLYKSHLNRSILMNKKLEKVIERKESYLSTDIGSSDIYYTIHQCDPNHYGLKSIDYEKIKNTLMGIDVSN